MEELSLHILDLVQNSIAAEADLINLDIYEDEKNDWLGIVIEDNGRGMDEATISKAIDPFYTTRTTRKVGLGLPLFMATARRCGGDVTITSKIGQGTKLTAGLQLGHIDRPPLGKLEDTIITLILCNPLVDLVYNHRTNKGEFELDTREIRLILGEVSMDDPGVIGWIKSFIKEGLNEINGGVQ